MFVEYGGGQGNTHEKTPAMVQENRSGEDTKTLNTAKRAFQNRRQQV